MGRKLYVGNLPFSVTDQILADSFSPCGTVASAKVITDRDTGRSRGFGFVELAEGAEEAIQTLHGSQFQGRTLTVNEARPREERPRVGSGFGGSRGGRY